MGRNAHGDLVFGVPLGGSDEGWRLTRPKDEWGYVMLEPTELPWLTADQIEDWESLNYQEMLELGLRHLDTVTFELTGEPLSTGLEVHTHGYELSSFALVVTAPQFGVEWGDTAAVDHATMRDVAEDERLRTQFEQAFAALNLHPVTGPAWFLTAEYF